jgi:hypothetical protein
VPKDFRDRWAEVNQQVLAAYFDAATGDPDLAASALKVFHILPSLFLRRPHRGGGNRASRTLHLRFAQWAARDYAGLIHALLRDYEYAAIQERAQPGRRETADQRERSLKKVVALVREGEYGRAAGLAVSNGLASINDPAVLAQLAHKHPRRPADGQVPDLPDIPDLSDEHVDISARDIEDVFQGLPRKVARGFDTWRYEYLHALAPRVPFVSPDAREAVTYHASALANGELPAWFMFWYTAVRLVPLNKKEVLLPSQPLEVRPIGIGSALRRAHTKAFFSSARVALITAHLYPQQLGCGVSDGGALLITAVREHLYARIDHAVVCVDLENAFNATSRRATLDRIVAAPALRVFGKFAAAILAPMSPVLAYKDGHMAQLPFHSEEGLTQGNVESSFFFNITIQPELVALDAALRPHGGMAIGGADDLNALGPPPVVFSAVEAFAAALERTTRLRRGADKTVCYIHPLHRGTIEPHRGLVRPGSVRDADGVAHFGVKIWGIPFGDDGYVTTLLGSVVDGAAGASRKLTSMLGSDNKQILWNLTYRSTQHKFGYHLRNMAPSVTLAEAQRFDTIIMDQATSALGVDPRADPVLHRRSRLPVSKRGLGLRSAAATAAPAFIGAICATVPALLDRRSRVDPSVTIRGLCPHLEDVVGADSFTDPEAAGWTGWARFQQVSPAGQEMVRRFQVLQEEVATLTGEDPTTGILAQAPASIHKPMSRTGTSMPGVQAELTEQLDEARFQALDESIRTLSPHDPSARQQVVWSNIDRCASAFLLSVPVGYGSVPPNEWVEIAAKFCGMPSPALRAFVGKRIAGTGGRGTVTVDPYGDALTCATLPGDHYRKVRHDPLVRLVATFAREFAGTYAEPEAWSAIAAALHGDPQASAQVLQRMAAGGNLRSFVPDLLLFLGRTPEAAVDRLLELKTVHVGPTHYPWYMRSPRAAVNKRARDVPAAYDRKAAALDARLFNTPPGQTGPVQDKLRSYGPVLPFVSGAFGEINDDGDHVLETLAIMGAEDWHHQLDTVSPDAAQAFLHHHMRMQVGMCGARGNARMLLYRLRFIVTCNNDRYPRFRTESAAPAFQFGADNAFHASRHQRECYGFAGIRTGRHGDPDGPTGRHARRGVRGSHGPAHRRARG